MTKAKKSGKVRAAMTILLAALMLTACAERTPPTGSTDTVTEEKTEEPAKEPVLSELKLAGNDLADYQIVYAQNRDHAVYENHVADAVNYYRRADSGKYPVTGETAEYFQSLIADTDTEFDRQTAEHLQQRLKEIFGAELPVVRDTGRKKQEKEIHIGDTDAGLAEETLRPVRGDAGYAVRLAGQKLSLCGNTYGASYQAVDAWIFSLKAEKKSCVELADNYRFSGQAELTVIACLGDSITYGSRSTDQDKGFFSYPAVLGRMLWKICLVYNYGVPGTTMCDSVLEKPEKWSYTRQTRYTEDCLGAASDFDVALIMLGTNDAWGNPEKIPPDRRTDSATRADFIATYQKIAKDLRAKNPDVKLCVMTAPTTEGNTYSGGGEVYLARYIRRWQRTAAEQSDSEIFEMGAFTAENLLPYREAEVQKDYHGDMLHPNDGGYAKIAGAVRAMLAEKYEIQ